MVRRLALCLAPAMALALAACSGNGSGSTGSNGSTGQGAGSTTGNTTSSSGAGSTTGLGGTTGVHPSSSGSSGSNGTSASNGSSGNSSGSGDLCDPCSSNADCQSGLCDTNAHQCQTTQCTANSTTESDCIDAQNSDGSGCGVNGSCSCYVPPPPAALCADCFDDSECQSGHCDQANFVCTTATCSGGADADSQACAAAGGSCQGGTCACPVPPREVCEYCAQGSDCASGICDAVNHQCQVSDCLADGGGSADSCLDSCNADGTCACAPLTAVCGECADDSECVTGHCGQNGQCVTATCAGGSDADSQACTGAGGTCQAGACACPVPPREVCDGCSQDSDCASRHCVGATATSLGQCQVTDCLADGGESGTEQTCLNSGSWEAQNACNPDGSCSCYPLGTTCDPDSFCFEGYDCAGGQCNQDDTCTAACSSNTDCPGVSGATCDTTAGSCSCPPPPSELCEDCSSTPCDIGLTCDPGSQLCQTTTCYADGGGAADDCYAASSSGTCNPDGSCICD